MAAAPPGGVAAPSFAEAIAASARREAEERAAREATAKHSRRAAEHTDGIPDWQGIREEAEARHGPGLYGLLLYQDDLLAARGIHPMSPWWRETFRQFFALRLTVATLMWIVALCGRGSGKSTTLERLAVVVALFAERDMPIGDAGWQWPFISVRPQDARRRIYEIAKLLRLAYAVDVKVGQPQGTYTIETADTSGNAIEFVSMASTIGNVSGPSTPGCTVDEAAKLQTNALGANPDGELIISLAETSRARKEWIGVRCSSAWETRGAHHANIIEGTNAVNFVPTIGPAFIDHALAGYEEVARFEEAQGNPVGAAQIRAWARGITAASPNVPTWTCNPTIGALASRILLDTLAKDDPTLEGLDRTTAWLRECGSMPLSRDGGFNAALQLNGLVDMNARLVAAMRGEPLVRVATGADVAPAKLRGMRPGDARYDSRDDTGPRQWTAIGWDRGDVF